MTERTCIIVEFVGLPGVGKTTLSQTVAEECRTDDLRIIEPIRKRESYSNKRRIASKAGLVCRDVLLHPQTTTVMAQTIFKTDQQSLSDLVRVAFNLYYVSAVVSKYRQSNGVCLLDQGPYQGIWSVGLHSPMEWSRILDRFDYQSKRIVPDLVIFVEANIDTIIDRLKSRENGSTRFIPDTTTFDRGVEGYELLKSRIESTDAAPESMVIRNETKADLKSSAIQVAQTIHSLRS